MQPFKDIYAHAAKRKGGKKQLEALLPKKKSTKELTKTPDDRFLAEMTKCVFRAGFVWKVIDKKWPDFELVFEGFHPKAMAFLSDEALEKIGKDKRIVRNMQKILTVRRNAQFILDITQEHGSFAQFIADWPEEDIVGLWDVLKKRGNRLGGATGQYFLRFMGKDTFMLTRDVVAALVNQGIIDIHNPTAKRDLQIAQNAFNSWHEETGRPYAELSRILACSVGTVEEAA